MLSLRIKENEYFTIDGSITVLVKAIDSSRVLLSIDAPREMPVVRGTLLEKGGEERPACLDAALRKKQLNSFSSGPANRSK